jgi:hypothetical protein
MAVIINDFEVVVQKPTDPSKPEKIPLPAPAPIRPTEIADTMRRHAERTARLMAY